VVDTIRESISILQAQFKNHSIDLKFDTEDEIKIFNYPNELKQVFLNLLNNSKDAILEIKATDKNFFGVIEVIVIKLEDGVQIDIIDNAGGIKDDVMDRIFEPYFTTKEQGKGTGIGLYMSKLIIENMKGSIYCKNSNNGAIFTIILPWKT
jgi:signal transduction histidine kinase